MTVSWVTYFLIQKEGCQNESSEESFVRLYGVHIKRSRKWTGLLKKRKSDFQT